MNKLLPTGLMTLVLAVSASSALACPPGGKGGHRIDKAVEKLELTTEQASQFREIMEAKHASIKSHHEALRAKTLNQLKKVLTKEQLAQFEEMSNHKNRHKDKKKPRGV